MARTFRDSFGRIITDPEAQDRYNSNNGVIVALTRNLDPEKRLRIYLGLTDVDLKDSEKNAQAVAFAAGLRNQIGLPVPLSADPDEQLIPLLRETFSEAQIKQVYPDYQTYLENYPESRFGNIDELPV